MEKNKGKYNFRRRKRVQVDAFSDISTQFFYHDSCQHLRVRQIQYQQCHCQSSVQSQTSKYSTSDQPDDEIDRPTAVNIKPQTIRRSAFILKRLGLVVEDELLVKRKTPVTRANSKKPDGRKEKTEVNLTYEASIERKDEISLVNPLDDAFPNNVFAETLLSENMSISKTNALPLTFCVKRKNSCKIMNDQESFEEKEANSNYVENLQPFDKETDTNFINESADSLAINDSTKCQVFGPSYTPTNNQPSQKNVAKQKQELNGQNTPLFNFDSDPVFRVPFPMKTCNQDSSVKLNSFGEYSDGFNLPPFHLQNLNECPIDSPSISPFLVSLDTNELPHLLLTPRLGLGTPRLITKCTPKMHRNAESDKAHQTPVYLGASPFQQVTPMLNQYEASIGIPIDAISTPYLSTSLAEGGADLLEMIDYDKEQVTDQGDRINTWPDERIVRKQSGDSQTINADTEPRQPTIKPFIWVNLHQRTIKPSGRHNKILSYELHQALKVRQKMRERKRKEKLKEQIRVTGEAEQNPTCKLLKTGRQTRSSLEVSYHDKDGLVDTKVGE